ncbi:MAG: peptidoglycan DD-metalloendopeptidase family protein [Clostridia bacterium]|nr:peptidoglycan DD-metalloendopeptidase family protein [Clostridia bacterium]
MNKFFFRNRKISFILSLVLIFSILTCYSVSANTTIDEYKDKIAEYEEKIDEAQGKIDALKGDISQVQEYIEELDKQVAMYQEQIDVYNGQIGAYQDTIDDYEAQNEELEAKIEELNKQIEECNAQIDEMNAQIDDKYDELKELIRTNYINGETSAIEVLLLSDDFSDYLTKVQFVSSLADYEQGLIDGINDDIEKVDATLAQIDTDKATIRDIQADIDAKIKEIETLQDAVEENKSKVQANQDIIQAKVDENSNYLASLNNESAEYEAMIEEYEAAIAQFDRQIQQMLQSNGSSGSGTLTNSSGLICPLQYSGVYVSSPFYRNSDGSYHGALDLCTYGGTYGKNISAAESGKVITASYHWSYGNYVVIDHGNGLSTLYAHCSSLAVSSGQSVSKGQTIAYVGSTGNSSGPHLHFEVRINGSRVNPAGYISV